MDTSFSHETLTHFIADCPRLGCIRDSFLEDLKVILNRTNTIGLVDGYLSASEQFVELLLDCSNDGPRGQLCIDSDMVLSIESLLRNLHYSLHQKRCEPNGSTYEEVTVLEWDLELKTF